MLCDRRLSRPRRAAWLLLAVLPWVMGAATARELTPYDYRGAPKDLILWGDLAKVGVVRASGRMELSFLPSVLALDGRTVTLVGFMTAVDTGQEHRRFLLSSRPLNCSHCVPVTPADLVEVSVRSAERLREFPVLVKGRLQLVRGAKQGPIYRLLDAAVVPRDVRASPAAARTSPPR